MAEPFSDEAMQFTKELVLQREVSSTAGHSGPDLILLLIVSMPIPVLVGWCSATLALTLLQSHSQSRFNLLGIPDRFGSEKNVHYA